MALRISLNCKAFRNTGTFGSPTWIEVKNVGDIGVVLEDEEGEANSRGAGGWAQSEPTLRKATIDLSMPYDPIDTALAAWIVAYLARTAVDLAFLDGASSGVGSQGPRAMWKFFKMERQENLAGVVSINFTMKPCYDLTNLPSWQTFA